MDKLKDIVYKEISVHSGCAVESISDDVELGDLGIDSLKAITILYELEDEFDIEIPNEVLESIRCVGDILFQIELIQNMKNQDAK